MKAIKSALDRIATTQILPNGVMFKWRDHLINCETQLRRIKRSDTDFIADTVIAVATEISLEISKLSEAKNEANRT